jgi:hypothetical protein
LNLTNGTINVVPLTDVKEFYIEGKLLHHCVYTNEYFKKDNSLILSARSGEERFETVEISLSPLKLIQSRGPCNQDSRYHKEIIELVNNNIDQIRKAGKTRKKMKQIA